VEELRNCIEEMLLLNNAITSENSLRVTSSNFVYLSNHQIF
jgi:hypothetical protein